MDSPAFNLLTEAALEQPAQHIAVFNAQAHPLWIKLTQQAEVSFSQIFKPYVLELEVMGLQVSDIQGEFELILFVPSKDKKQSLGWMAQAINHLSNGGKLMMACENQYGAKSYESALKKLAGATASSSKSKCRLFSAKKTDSLNVSLQQQWLDDAKPQVMESHGLWTQAGLFSWKSADIGSAMLLKHLPKLSGKVMDLCCGYGLLANHIIKHNDNVSALHLVEADSLALDCAVQNTKGFAYVSTHHLDAVHELLPKHMDTVVCNPPFHTGQTRDVELGQHIVSKACGALTHGGELYLVANRQLPYEKILHEQLRDVECLAAHDGFKVIRGKK
ncbi:MAG: methyltransferase [Ghiorsea sp.]|nr:methyltransferase [Ghiorsea sp.]